MARSRENFTFTKLKTHPFYLPLVLSWRSSSSLSTTTSLFTTTTIIIIITIAVIYTNELDP
jgi:hypothetical protein